MNKLIEELPERLKNRLSIYLYRRYQLNIDFFRSNNNDKFIIWIVPKLKEIMMIEDSWMQQENEKLQYMYFIFSG